MDDEFKQVLLLLVVIGASLTGWGLGTQLLMATMGFPWWTALISGLGAAVLVVAVTMLAIDVIVKKKSYQ